MQDASEWVLKRKLLTRGFLTAFHKAGQEQCVLQVSIPFCCIIGDYADLK
jgi:hypothetical protein